MAIFTVKYRYKTKPLFRKGQWATQEVSFKAENRLECLRKAKKYGEMIWNRRKWELLDCRLREA